jgi:hypothetical protein
MRTDIDEVDDGDEERGRGRARRGSCWRHSRARTARRRALCMWRKRELHGQSKQSKRKLHDQSNLGDARRAELPVVQ